MATGIIGNPIKHSLSPALHSFWMKEHKIESIYNIYELEKKNISSFLNSLKDRNIVGLNVTIPYKNTIIQYLDSINTRAESIGSVNCLMKVNSEIIGNNTDWYGFIMSIKQNNIDLNNKNVVVLGAGGAAKAVIFSLNQDQVHQADLNLQMMENYPSKTLQMLFLGKQ